MLKERGIRVRYVLAFWLFILSAVAYLDRTNISIAGLAISREYGLGNQRLGWIFSSFLIGYAAFQLPAGWLSSRFGPRRVLTVGVLLWGVMTALTAMLPTTIEHAVLLLIGVRFVLGVGESVHLSGGQPVCGVLGATEGARRHQWADLRRCGSGQWTDAADAELADQSPRLALRVLVQRDSWICCRDCVVADCAGHPGGASGGTAGGVAGDPRRPELSCGSW